MSGDDVVRISPRDEQNRALLANVHPSDWTPPEPQPLYNLVVIGAGTAGLISSFGCAALDGKVALVERGLMGGDCLNVGCVPSKCLIRSSRAAAALRDGARFGLADHGTDPDRFPAVMERLRRIRAEISANDSAARYAAMGVDVFLGDATFVGRHAVRVGETELRFHRAIIATGARAVEPPIPGLAEAGFLTNESVFNLIELPRRLAVIGGGPIGCELSQAFSRLGAEVTIVERSGQLLAREDPDAAGLLARVLAREGVAIRLEAETKRVETADGAKQLVLDGPDGEEIIEADAILIAAGRRPNVDGLGLEEAGVAYDARKGVEVDDRLRTTNRDIFAAGDVCMGWKFTHAADAAARIAVRNALFMGRKRLSGLTMPWCTYTDPEVAHVGLYEREAEERGIPTETYRAEMNDVDRAIADGETEGFVKILVREGSDRILGATIVATHAGEMIGEVSVAMAGKVGLGGLANVIHPYPTQAEAIRRAAAGYTRSRLTPRLAGVLRWWLNRQLRGADL